MPASLIEGESLLAVDVGAASTRAVLFDVVEGQYRFIAAGKAPTTAEAPFKDIGLGVREALAGLQSVTGRTLLDADRRLITPSQPDGSGVDGFAATLSAGPLLRTAIVGLLSEVSLESVRRLAAGTYARLVESMGLSDHRKAEQQIDDLLRARPDLIIIAGGTDGGASRAILKMLESVGLACFLLPQERRPAVLFAGNQALADEVKTLLGGLSAALQFSPNVRPSLDTEDIVPAARELARLSVQVRQGQLRGVDELVAWSGGHLLPTAYAEGRIIRFLSRVYSSARGAAPSTSKGAALSLSKGAAPSTSKGAALSLSKGAALSLSKGAALSLSKGAALSLSKGLLGVDLGATGAVIAAGFHGALSLNVFPQFGLGENLSGLQGYTELDDILRWIPLDIPPGAVRDYLYQKSLYPASIAASREEHAIEQAVARQCLHLAVQAALKTFPPGARFLRDGLLPLCEPILASGGMLGEAATPGQSLLLLLDALQPVGITTVILDQNNLLPLLGAAAERNNLLPVQVLESGAFLSLGTVVSVISSTAPGTPVLRARLLYDDGSEMRAEVRCGGLEALPLAAGQSARLSVQSLHGAEAGFGSGRGGTLRVSGGALGVVLDARGRPLQLPADAVRRRELIKKWLWTIGG